MRGLGSGIPHILQALDGGCTLRGCDYGGGQFLEREPAAQPVPPAGEYYMLRASLWKGSLWLAVLLPFMCHLDSATMCPDIGLNIILGVSVRVFSG